MEEWKEYKLGDVCNIVGRIGFRGYTTEDLTNNPNDGAITLSPTNIVDGELDLSKPTYIKWPKYYESPEIMLDKNDIVLVKTGSSIGRTTRIREIKHPMTLNPQFVVLKDIKVNNIFLSYIIKSPYFQALLRAITVGSAIPTLSQKNLAKLEIRIPEDKEQKRIASILSSLDDKIELNRKINANLEAQAQALFKSWFVDFEPFKDQPFVESELGMIPEGWRVYSMDELVNVIGGYSYKGNELQESTTAMATIKNFERSGGFKTNGFKEIVPSPKAKHEQFLKKFDIIIAHTDLTQNADIIGNPALILNFDKYEKLIMSMDLVKVNSKNIAITYGLLYSIFSDERFKSHALGYVNGTTVLHLSKKAIPEYKLALPCNLSILTKYGNIFDSLFAKEAEIMDENSRLASLRDTLLPRLMSGELKVNDINI